MSSVEQAELRALVVKACARSVSAVISGSDRNSSRCVISKPYFIKWAEPELHDAAATQKYVYSQAIQDPKAPRVPKVYDCFDHDTITYLVMEYIQTSPTLDATYFHQQTANAIDWLLRLPAPPGAGIGPLGGGYAIHPIFGEWTAPLRFSCNEALEIFLNKSLECLPGKSHWDPIRIRDEPLVFTQSDMHEGNFILDHTGRPCLVDFDSVGLLPKSFAVYTVKASGKPFVRSVAKYLPTWTSPNLVSLSKAGAILMMLADATLGLDENGRTRVTVPTTDESQCVLVT